MPKRIWFLLVFINYLICLQQLRSSEKIWVQPSETAIEWNVEEQKTEVCSFKYGETGMVIYSQSTSHVTSML